MKRQWFIVLLAVLLLSLPASGVLALVLGLPSADTFIDATMGQTNLPHNLLALKIQGSSGAGGGCSPVRTVYMKWPMTSLTTTPGYAKLTFTAEGTSNAAGFKVAIYRVDDSVSWNESLTYDTVPMPQVTDLIQEVTLPATITPGTTKVVFGDTDTALLDYVKARAGQTVMSIAVRFTTCAGTSIQFFNDRESGVTGPQLDIRTAPNAVQVSRASARPVSWPLYASLGAVALFVVAGVVISRLRTA